jgi:hypothetical protein
LDLGWGRLNCILSLKIQINHKNQVFEDLPFNSSARNWDVPLLLLERSQWVGFIQIYFVSFGLRMWEISNFKWFSSLQIQISYKKPGFRMKI